jgi:hypothetical protein
LQEAGFFVLRRVLDAALAALLVGCASTPREACCTWAGVEAKTLLGHDGVDCGTVRSHPLEPRTEQLRCARDAAKRGVPYMIAYRDSTKPSGEVLDVAIFSAQGEKILLQRAEEGAGQRTYVGTCSKMSVASDGRIQRADCIERVPPATG